MSTKSLRIVVVGQLPEPVEPERTLVLAPATDARAPEGARVMTPPDGAAPDGRWLKKIVTSELRRLSEVWGSAPPREPTAHDLLREVQKHSCWYGEDDARTRASIEVYEAHPDRVPDAVAKAVRNGTEDRQARCELDNAVRLYGANDARVRELAARLLRERPHLRNSVEKALSYDRSVRMKREERNAARREGRPITSVKPSSHSHRLQDLAPSEHWRLYIDESGSDFGGPAQAPGRAGRIVGVLVPQPAALAAPASVFHGTEATNADADALLQRLLDAPVGVLGIEASGLPETAGERWTSGVIELIQWTVRLMPKSGPTTLDVIVEQRGIHDSAASWDALAAHVERGLVEIDPARYQDLDLRVRVMPKDGDLSLGYADVVAYTWGSPSDASKARLTASGLARECLIAGAPDELRKLWDQLGRPALLSGNTWRAAVSNPSATDEASLPGILLRRLGQTASADVTLWRRLTEAALSHLDSKAVDLRAVGREVAWLEQWRPEQAQLSGSLQLAWLVARIEAANHSGDTSTVLLHQLDALSEQLFDEAPELVCQADLIRAVLATNLFDFDGATSALRRWRELPPAVPGLRHWARVQSSLGQHAAFRGEFAEARRYFRVAIEAFQRLSDPAIAALELSQTRTYDAIAAMDDPAASLDDVRAAMKAVTPLELDAIRILGSSSAPRDKYRHHLLVRYLAAHGTSEEREAYLSMRKDWRSGEGHPWPLIHAWRAALLAKIDPEEALVQVMTACEDALSDQQGPVLQYIGVVISTAAAALGVPNWDDSAYARLDWLLPLASERLAFLRTAHSNGVPYEEVLRRALPFNFR